jgi:hypothetical protein
VQSHSYKVVENIPGKKAAYLKTSTGKTGYPHVEDRKQIPISHAIQNSTQNLSKTSIQALKL